MTIHRGLGGVNREVKQQFRGLGGVDREIKEEYRGLSGVNRKVFSKTNKPAGALYWYGDECVDKTGGWVLINTLQTYTTAIKNTNNVYLKAISGGASSWRYAQLYSVNKINMSGYTKLKVRCSGYITQNAVCTACLVDISGGNRDTSGLTKIFWYNQDYMPVPHSWALVDIEYTISPGTNKYLFLEAASTYVNAGAWYGEMSIEAIWLE